MASSAPGGRQPVATPCLVSAASTRAKLHNRGDTRAITVHDRADPCGHATAKTDPIPTFVEFVEDAVAGRTISVRACKYCGGSLRL